MLNQEHLLGYTDWENIALEEGFQKFVQTFPRTSNRIAPMRVIHVCKSNWINKNQTRT